MILKRITLLNFRNIEKDSFDFSPISTIIIGKNSVGKTNLLESIYFLCTGSGFRDEKQVELMGDPGKNCDVDGQFQDEDVATDFRIVLHRDKTSQKSFFVDKSKKMMFSYMQSAPPAGIFSPSFMYLIDGQMSERRRFIDKTIGRVDREYKKCLSNYESGLRKRNKLIQKAISMGGLQDQLPFWDRYLQEQADYLVEKRGEFVQFLNENKKIDKNQFTIEYRINKLTAETLKATFEKQFYVKRTVVGPQRDEFEISIKQNDNLLNVHTFGSRSQQRLALLWLIINEIKFYFEKLGRRPILLLDDVFSELDNENRNLILGLIKNYQTVITTTDDSINMLLEVPHTVIKL